MKNRSSIILYILLVCFAISVKANKHISTNKLLLNPQIDALDKVVFDLANAKMKNNFIDIPVFFLSNDVISALDFSLKFNETNLTFDSIVNYKSDLLVLSNFNKTDRFLRFTSNSFSFKQIEVNKPLFALRFHFTTISPCNELSAKDFNSISVYLNGDPCSFKFTNAPPFNVPIANFVNSIPCLNSEITFIDSSKLIVTEVSSWSWNFGNGTFSNLKDPVLKYATVESYTVTLIVKSTEGCADTVTKVLNINPSPLSNFTFVSDCSTGNMMFTDLSTIIFGTINKWKWDFGEDSTSSVMNPIYNYQSAGTYTTTLTTTSDSGCISIYKRLVLVDLLSARFNPKNACIGAAVNFLDSSLATNSSGPITNWKWDFGEANTSSSLQNPVYIYTKPGNYLIHLTVSNLTCSDSISKIITIENFPIVNFSEDKISGCMPLTVNFSDTTKNDAGYSYSWNFGDKDTSFSKNARHTFINNGNYTIKHFVTTAAGCTNSLEKTSHIQVLGEVARFTASAKKIKLPNARIQFSNGSNGYIDWTWNFGDSLYSTNKNPEHTYMIPGNYLVCLVGKHFNGCASNYCDTITVVAPNVVAIPNVFTPNGDNVNDILTVRGGPIKEIKLKIFNQWGNRIFESNTQDEGWDGNFKGTPQAVGVYEYTIIGKTFDNEAIDMHGVVNLVR